MDSCNRDNNCFRICHQVNIRIGCDRKILYQNCITNLHRLYVDLYSIYQCCRQCLVGNLFQLLLQDSIQHFLMIQQNYFCYGMYLFVAYQCLKINLRYLILHGIIVNFLDQHVVGLAIYIQHHLTAFIAGF